MLNIQRRLFAQATLTGAAPALAQPSASAMDIQRHEQAPRLQGIPLISWAVAHGDMVYLSGITPKPRELGGEPEDIKSQTREVLARVDELLAKAGSHKSRVLSAQVWLTDMALFAEHNEAWNEWVDPANPPARACLNSPKLWRPGMLVEVMLTAVKAHARI
ncbi:MAG TPA: RidA family protein [Burkholderiaceae bacterium]|nr:RidA family protein [Burkholderiaceae bacterium]